MSALLNYACQLRFNVTAVPSLLLNQTIKYYGADIVYTFNLYLFYESITFVLSPPLSVIQFLNVNT